MDKSLVNIPIERIRPSRFQPRTSFDPAALLELAQSIEAQGVIDEPIVFVPDNNEESEEPIYELIAGERRVRAAIAVAWAKLDDQVDLEDAIALLAEDGFVPLARRGRSWLTSAGIGIVCRIQESLDLAQIRRMVIIEGLQRANLSPIEEARALQSLLVAESLSQRDLAAQIGKSQAYIQQRLSLLGMPAAVQEAVASERISATQARAIAAAPQQLQETLAKQVTAAEDAGDRVGTRELELATRELARFTDPDRWLPNAETVYRPIERNHLALIRWALQRADLAAVGDALLALRIGSQYDGGNLLSKQARTIAVSGQGMTRVMQALGFKHLEAAWDQFAVDHGRMCENCVFGQVEQPTEVDPMFRAYCPRWRDPERIHCSNYIGVDDPVVIPIDEYYLRREFAEHGAPLESMPFEHMRSVSDYVKAYQLVVSDRLARVDQETTAKQRQYLVEIERFIGWQRDQPADVLDHPQAHACRKCIHQTPDGSCRFASEPLHPPFDKGLARAPEFGALVAADGRILPRCEMFAFADMPRIRRVPDWRIGDPDQLLGWLRRIIKLGIQRSTTVLPGYLAWIPYGRGPGGNDYNALITWIRDHWDDLGNDEAIPTLLDIVVSESEAMSVDSCSTITLLNPTTGQHEFWVPVKFDVAIGYEPLSDWRLKEWPEEFQRPWEAKPEPEPEPDPELEKEYPGLFAEFNEDGNLIEPEPQPRPALSHRELAEELQIPVDAVAIVRELRIGTTFLAKDALRRYEGDPVAAARLLAKLRSCAQRVIDAIDEDTIMEIDESDAGRILTPEVME